MKEHESAGNDSSDNRKYLAFIADDSHDANYQGSKEWEGNQQPSKGSKGIASAGTKYSKCTHRGDGYT